MTARTLRIEDLIDEVVGELSVRSRRMREPALLISVSRPPGSDRLDDDAFRLAARCQVAADENGFAASCLDATRDGRGLAIIAVVVDGHVGAIPSESIGDSGSDAGACPCHQNPPSLKTFHVCADSSLPSWVPTDNTADPGTKHEFGRIPRPVKRNLWGEPRYVRVRRNPDPWRATALGDRAARADALVGNSRLTAGIAKPLQDIALRPMENSSAN